MDLERRMWRVNSYLRAQLPASCAEETIRKLSLTYYLYIKLFGERSMLDVESTASRVIKAFENPETIVENDLTNTRFEFLNHVYGSRNEIIRSIENGIKDYVFYANDGNHNYDPMQVSIIFADIPEKDLLEYINASFENSIRDDSTPDSVTELVLRLAEKYCVNKGTVTDMTCSSGSFLLKASKLFKTVEGVELNIDNANLAKIRMAISGIPADIRQGNCFEDSWHHQSSRSKSDLVFAEFPWKMIVKDYGLKEIMFNCNANRFYLGNNSSTDYFFLSAMMNYLKRDGVAITVMPLSSLSNLSDKVVREHIVKDGYLKEVITLPGNIFGRTGIQTAIVVLTLERNDKVAFFDGSEFFKQERRRISSIDVDALLTKFEEAKTANTCYFSLKEMEEKEYSFSPAHYLKKVENTIPNASELSTYADIFTGWQVQSAKLESIHRTDGTGTKLLQMSNVDNGAIVSNLEKYDIPENTVQKFVVQKGDVVISTKSLRVKSAVVDIDTNEPIVAAGSIMVIRPSEGKLNPYYLVAYFESDLGKQVLEMYQTGNVIPNLSINNVKKIPIPGLSYERQCQIGEQYRDLRDLIQSEKERLRLLENKVNKMLDNLWDAKEGE